MIIAIIGAGISGLTAGRLLARAGHEVTIFEKSNGFGGRMATRYAGKDNQSKMDHGLSYFSAESIEFQEFTAELLEKKLIKTWGNKLFVYDGENLYNKNPNDPGKPFFASIGGMNTIGKYLARWVDVQTKQKVGGLTYYGGNRTRKRPWIVNFSSSATFSADAVIIALPAPQAYGILSTTIDETSTLKIVRRIDEIRYKPAYSLMVGYGDRELPDWNAVLCTNCNLDFISNETSKREKQECSFVLHAGKEFTKKHKSSDEDTITREMLADFTNIAGGWASSPNWHQLHFWRYSRAEKVMDAPYFELENHEAPLAVVGDYFEGNRVDNAYKSGYLLARHWLDKFEK